MSQRAKSCVEIEPDLMATAMGEAEPAQSRRVDAHVGGCPPCHRSLEQYRTIDHEVGNVAKCLKAGFANVTVIATSEDRLRKLESAVKNSLGAQTNVSYFLPDQFIAWLESLTLQDVGNEVNRDAVILHD